jgi:hypothetical protein
MKVGADRLRKVLGLSRMSFHDVNHPIAITDVPLDEQTEASAGNGHDDAGGMHEALERVEAPTPLRRRPIVR